MLLLLLMALGFTLVTGAIYAWVSTYTSNPMAIHSGGSPSFCSGTATHYYYYGNCSTVVWEYRSLLLHNGINIDGDFDMGYDSSGNPFSRMTTMGAGATAVYSNHSAAGYYSSAIRDTNSSAYSSDSKQSNIPRDTD